MKGIYMGILGKGKSLADIFKKKKATYDFKDYEDRLKEAIEASELGKLSNVTEQEPIEPLIDIGTPRYTKSSDSVIYTSSQKKDGVADIILAGDIMCRMAQQNAALEKYGKFDFQDMFVYMDEILHGCDFLIGNLETTLSESAKYTYEMNRCDDRLNRNSPSTMLDALKTAGFDMLITSNNHCLDAGLTGIYQTICHLKQYGFMYTGTFLDKADRKENRFVLAEIDGIKVGFVGYTYGTNGRARLIKKTDHKYYFNKYSAKKAQLDIKAARKAGAEFIVAYHHWGKEFVQEPNEKQLLEAKELADAGADFIAGSHPHCTQPFGHVISEDGRTVPVIYSMGNFISSMDRLIGRDSVLINLKLIREDGSIKIKEISYIPCFTCIEYKERLYTTVPLTDSMCRDNQELIDSRERSREIMGAEISESELLKDER